MSALSGLLTNMRTRLQLEQSQFHTSGHSTSETGNETTYTKQTLIATNKGTAALREQG